MYYAHEQTHFKYMRLARDQFEIIKLNMSKNNLFTISLYRMTNISYSECGLGTTYLLSNQQKSQWQPSVNPNQSPNKISSDVKFCARFYCNCVYCHQMELI